MKILNTSSFVLERVKVKPITNAEWDKVRKDLMKFNLTQKDLVGDLKGFPIGIVVRMLEEQKKQKNNVDVKVFQENRFSDQDGFVWENTVDEELFWFEIMSNGDFTLFFEKHPEYKKYNAPTKPNPFGLTNADLNGNLQDMMLGIVVKMLEEQKLQNNDPDVKVFQSDINAKKHDGGVDWKDTDDGIQFWEDVLYHHNYLRFFNRYPEYEQYNIY